MKKRSKLTALIGAAALTFGMVAIALAVELKEPHQGFEISIVNGSIVVMDGEEDVTADFVIDCDEEFAEGMTSLHFVQSPTDADSGNLDVDFSDDAQDVTGQASAGGQGSQVDWDVDLDLSGGAVTLITAESDIDGGELKLSHICGTTTEETAPPSFEQSEEAETDAPSVPVTDEPSFEQSQAADTDAPSEPQTDAITGTGNSAPADGAWLLVVALGVLLASIVVLTPARAKGRR
jgi:hypothetical protein